MNVDHSNPYQRMMIPTWMTVFIHLSYGLCRSVGHVGHHRCLTGRYHRLQTLTADAAPPLSPSSAKALSWPESALVKRKLMFDWLGRTRIPTVSSGLTTEARSM